MKSIWTGAIGFGLVNIPVKMYSAVHDSSLDLDMLDKKDLSNIRFRRVNENTGKEVAWENIVRGYKSGDRYIVLTDEDFEKASPEKTKLIDISEFVDEREIDSMYYETPYYLEPEKSGIKAYALLRDALHKTGKAAFGSYVLRNRESLCMIKPKGGLLILNKIRFAEEIRTAEEIRVPGSKAKPAELKMAIELIDRLTGKFNISGYKDSYSADLMKLIKAKARGKKPAQAPLRLVHSRGKDLLSQLKASLETGSRKKKAS